MRTRPRTTHLASLRTFTEIRLCFYFFFGEKLCVFTCEVARSSAVSRGRGVTPTRWHATCFPTTLTFTSPQTNVSTQWILNIYSCNMNVDSKNLIYTFYLVSLWPLVEMFNITKERVGTEQLQSFVFLLSFLCLMGVIRSS